MSEPSQVVMLGATTEHCIWCGEAFNTMGELQDHWEWHEGMRSPKELRQLRRGGKRKAAPPKRRRLRTAESHDAERQLDFTLSKSEQERVA